MNETNKRIAIYYIIITVLLGIIFMLGLGFSFQTCRLVETRYELKSIRMELSAASDKQQRIGEIVRGTNEILSESFITIGGLREQIAAIRESYEEMENLLYNIDANNSGLNNLDNCEALNNEAEVGRSN